MHKSIKICYFFISIKIVHEVHTKGSKHDMNKKVKKYTRPVYKNLIHLQ